MGPITIGGESFQIDFDTGVSWLAIFLDVDQLNSSFELTSLLLSRVDRAPIFGFPRLPALLEDAWVTRSTRSPLLESR